MNTSTDFFDNSFILNKSTKEVPLYSDHTISALSKSSVRKLVPYLKYNNLTLKN